MPGLTFSLSDGRALGYAVYGDPNGQPVFCFLNNNSRRFYPFDDSIARNLHLRLINVERPGIGFSDPKPNRTLLDWPNDLIQLADHLNLNRFALLGLGSGGPHAAACAFKLPNRVAALTLVSSFAPPIDAGRNPGLVERIQSLAARASGKPQALTHEEMRQDSVKAWRNFHERLPECDRELVRIYGPRYLKPSFMRDVYDELYRQGVEGLMQDDDLMTRPWGFDLEAITVSTRLWYGDADTITPIKMSRTLAAHIPNCQIYFWPHEGHLLYLKHWQEILAESE